MRKKSKAHAMAALTIHTFRDELLTIFCNYTDHCQKIISAAQVCNSCFKIFKKRNGINNYVNSRPYSICSPTIKHKLLPRTSCPFFLKTALFSFSIFNKIDTEQNNPRHSKSLTTYPGLEVERTESGETPPWPHVGDKWLFPRHKRAPAPAMSNCRACRSQQL